VFGGCATSVRAKTPKRPEEGVLADGRIRFCEDMKFGGIFPSHMLHSHLSLAVLKRKCGTKASVTENGEERASVSGTVDWMDTSDVIIDDIWFCLTVDPNAVTVQCNP